MITTANSTARVKILALIFLIAVLIMVYPRSTQAGWTIRIQSWNLRYDSMPNDITVDETIAALNKTVPIDTQTKYYSDDTEQPWSTRRIGIKNEVLFNEVDLFTVNEGLHRQVEDLKELLDMPYIGVGRDDGAQAGEYQAIFYNPESIKLLSNDTFWLSDEPFEPSKYPGAGSYRSCTVGYFQTNKGGTKFVVINAHLDDQSDDQRRLGAALIKYRAAYEQETKKAPVFLVGDFNSQVSGETNGAYKITTGRLEFPIDRLNSTFVSKYNHSGSGFEFLDLIEATPVENRLGNLATFTGFKNDVDSFSRIDFQFGSNTSNWEAIRYKVGENWYDDSYYLSDHRPVISDIFLKLLLRPSPITTNFVSKAVPRTRFISNQLARPMARPLAPKLGVSLGVLGISSYWLYHNQIKNEVAFGDQKRLQLESTAQDIAQKPQYDKSLGGKLDYQELSIGSMCGLVCGMVVGKLSSIFVFLSLSFYLGVQFLNSRGIVTIPWTRYIKMGSHLIDVRQMIFEKPSFNITFILTFLLAAYYI